MKDDLRIIALARRWPHHTASGGYDRLARELGADVVLRTDSSQSRTWWQSMTRAWWNLRERSRRHTENYRYEDWQADERLLAQTRRDAPDAVHILYGDDDLHLLPRRRAFLRCPLIATFHLPGAMITRVENFQKHLVNGLDAAVVVSRSQLKDFSDRLGDDRVAYIPHGIDTKRFVPPEHFQPREGITLITVGDHLRDFHSLRRIVDECNTRQLRVKFELIMPEKHWQSFAAYTNVHLQTGVGEDDLIRAYQNADALLLPVTDSTANNAVLESLACGTPVISNAVGGMTDYVDDSCGWLFQKGESAGIVKFIAALCDNKENAFARRAAARRKALEFDWAIVTGQMRAFHRKVVAGVSPGKVAAI